MYTSEQIGELSAALAKAQGEIQNAVKDKVNPYFRSKYTDLCGIWDACRKPLSSNGLCVLQTIEPTETGMALVTRLSHSSGQWIMSKMPIIAQKMDPQGIGSAITYFKRYMLAALVGVATEDDDGEASMDRSQGAQGAKCISEAQIKFLGTTLKGDASKLAQVMDYVKKNIKVEKIEEIPMAAFNSVLEFAKSLNAPKAQQAVAQSQYPNEEEFF